jgi:hypothetical protein
MIFQVYGIRSPTSQQTKVSAYLPVPDRQLPVRGSQKSPISDLCTHKKRQNHMEPQIHAENCQLRQISIACARHSDVSSNYNRKITVVQVDQNKVYMRAPHARRANRTLLYIVQHLVNAATRYPIHSHIHFRPL